MSWLSEIEEMQRKEPHEKQPDAVDRSWHLARTAVEVDVAEIEYALMRAYEAFGRWQTECLASVVDIAASGPENAMLHIIRMNDRPKTIKDLARLANREDIPNIQYSLRKLIGAGLVVRQGSGRSGVTYQVTESGRAVTDQYADIRASLLIAAIKSVPNFPHKLEEATRTLELLTGIYEQVARVAATHRRSHP
ncbi:winged helix DNA-binding protein [Rhizobium sp. BK399]|uniref:winged helix DNA-binding protein n=1 Tax=Rhizobium sp. BK399 TaxID=2587063 RepID=UPI0018341F67|nr:winged helix DNA-binding protein [Rhizobium sp. BK399]MBB3545011.1 putative MarR family transcription regulator [Rhizobium sp. BK399]